jgi:hypothetical protein
VSATVLLGSATTGLLSICDGFAMVPPGCAEGFLGACEGSVKKDCFYDLLRVCFKFFYWSAVASHVVC